MLFGYAGAVIAGFLLTAVPNWTGRLPVRGALLLGLWLVWLAARLANVAAARAPWLAAGLDVGFWALLVAAMGREVAVGRNWRNLPVIGLVAVLTIACLLSQAEATGPATVWRSPPSSC